MLRRNILSRRSHLSPIYSSSFRSRSITTLPIYNAASLQFTRDISKLKPIRDVSKLKPIRDVSKLKPIGITRRLSTSSTGNIKDDDDRERNATKDDDKTNNTKPKAKKTLDKIILAAEVVAMIGGVTAIGTLAYHTHKPITHKLESRLIAHFQIPEFEELESIKTLDELYALCKSNKGKKKFSLKDLLYIEEYVLITYGKYKSGIENKDNIGDIIENKTRGRKQEYLFDYVKKFIDLTNDKFVSDARESDAIAAGKPSENKDTSCSSHDKYNNFYLAIYEDRNILESLLSVKRFRPEDLINDKDFWHTLDLLDSRGYDMDKIMSTIACYCRNFNTTRGYANPKWENMMISTINNYCKYEFNKAWLFGAKPPVYPSGIMNFVVNYVCQRYK